MGGLTSNDPTKGRAINKDKAREQLAAWRSNETYTKGTDADRLAQEQSWRTGFGDEYIDTEGRRIGDPPAAPDATDALLRKARASAFLRLQTGKNRSSSLSTQGTLGAFDVNAPVLGGY